MDNSALYESYKKQQIADTSVPPMNETIYEMWMGLRYFDCAGTNDWRRALVKMFGLPPQVRQELAAMQNVAMMNSNPLGQSSIESCLAQSQFNRCPRCGR